MVDCYIKDITKCRINYYIKGITENWKGETAYARQYFYNNSYNGDFHGK